MVGVGRQSLPTSLRGGAALVGLPAHNFHCGKAIRGQPAGDPEAPRFGQKCGHLLSVEGLVASWEPARVFRPGDGQL